MLESDNYVMRINSRGNLMLTSGCRLCKDDIPVKTWIFLYTNRFLKTKESQKGALYEKRFLHSKNYDIHPVIELTILQSSNLFDNKNIYSYYQLFIRIVCKTTVQL